MIIKLDYREKKLNGQLLKLKDTNKFDKISIVLENLPIGDVIICDDDGKEKMIIERKTLSDLASSIKDGRYAEQSYRLNGYSMVNHNIVYLLEGIIADWPERKARMTRTPKKTLYVTMFSLQYYKGFTTINTKNVEETAEYIVRVTDKLSRDKKQCYYDSSCNYVPYTAVVKKEKKKNITPENIDIIMLNQIPGISLKTSEAIIEKYKTVYNLIQELNENLGCLDNVKLKATNGERKISKTAVKNIKEYLLKEK
jgi:ERCC4-type nuclease